ncbi:MAG: LysM domain-containing protein [Actinomycetota bacterium]
MKFRVARRLLGIAALSLSILGCSDAPRYDLGDTPIPTTVPATTTTVPDVTTLDAAVVASAEASFETEAASPDVVVHVIESGDLLYDLALEYGTSVDAVLAANPQVDPDAVSIGTEVLIPLSE